MKAKSYLFIIQGIDLLCCSSYDDEDVNSVMDGDLQIVDITDPVNPQEMRFDAGNSLYFYPVGKA